MFPFLAHSFLLDTGLEVVVVPMNSPGAVASQLRLRVGARNEVEAGRTGFAHFFEHLMFSDTTSLTREQREQHLLELGVRDSAWTSSDRTVYHAVVPAASLDGWLGIQGGSFAGLQLTPDAVRREAGAVYGEWRKSQASPSQALFAALYRTAFTVHPYGHTVIGLQPDIEAMPTAFEHAQVFAAQWVRPENATLFLVGDVTLERAKALAEQHFSNWNPAPFEAPVLIPDEPDQTEARRVEVQWKTPTTPRVFIAWKVPPARVDEDTAALRALQALLFGPKARLHNRLVREEALAIDVGGGHLNRVDPGLFLLRIRAKRVEDLERIEQIVEEELQRLRDTPPEDVLEAAKQRQRYQTLTGLDTPKQVLQTVAARLADGNTIDDLDAGQRLYSAVTGAEIQRVLKEILVPEHRTTAILRGKP